MNALSRPTAAAVRTWLRCRTHAKQSTPQRNFSARSPSLRSHGLPVFQESSSAELDEVLATMRDKIFVPGYLNPLQKKLIRHRRFATQLENDPTYATIGDEEVQLHHIDPTKDVPKTWQCFNRTLDLAQTGRDWSNVLGVLTGLNNADLQKGVRTGWREKFVRKACQGRRVGVVIQALQQVERNGLSLKEPGVRFLLFKGIYDHAQGNDWSKAALDESIRWAFNAVDLFEHPGHCGGRVVADGDGRTDPFVIGVMLELFAKKSQLHLDGADESGDVQKYMSRLLAVIKQQTTELDVDQIWSEPPLKCLSKKLKPQALAEQRAYALNHQVAKWLPVYDSFRSSLSVLRPAVSQGTIRDVEEQQRRIFKRINVSYEAFEKNAIEHPEAFQRLTPCSAVEQWRQFLDKKAK